MWRTYFIVVKFNANGKKLIHCTLLNPALDCIYSVNNFQPGVTYVDSSVNVVPAGKGVNVARVIATLGEQVCVTGLMPENDVNRSTQFLDRLGIDHSFITIPGSMRINTTILDKNSRSITHINCTAETVGSEIQDQYEEYFSSVIHQNDLCCFSGSLPSGFESSCYGSLIHKCTENGCTALLDSRDDALKFGIRSRPSMIKPNLDELENFFGEQIRGVHHIALKGKRLLDMGIEYVFISLGEDGMIAVHGNDCLLCSAPHVSAKDTVGCGDALTAGLLVARQRKFSFPEMCRIAVACGTSKALHEGPGVISSDEVWQLMEDVEITAV